MTYDPAMPQDETNHPETLGEAFSRVMSEVVAAMDPQQLQAFDSWTGDRMASAEGRMLAWFDHDNED